VRRAHRGIALSALVLALGVFGGAPSAGASALEDPPANLTWGDSTVTVDYGDWLVLDFSGASWLSDYDCCLDEYNPISVIASGVPDDFDAVAYFEYNDGDIKGTAYQTGDGRPLEAGTYTFVLRAEHQDGDGNTITENSPQATVEVIPAELGIDFAGDPDDAASNNMIFSASFSGKFAQNFGSEDFPNSPIAPKGTWQFRVKDSTGAEVARADVPADGSMAASWYWTGGQANETYTASVTFDEATSTDASFDVTPASDITFTASGDTRPVPASTAQPAPATTVVAPQGFQTPLWLVILIVVLIAGFAASSIALIVRYKRVTTSQEGATDV
jgi:hypothetical protein